MKEVHTHDADDSRAAPGSRWLDGLRWRIALLIAPEIAVAGGKRRLESIARECGVSRSAAKRIAAVFFNGARAEHAPSAQDP